MRVRHDMVVQEPGFVRGYAYLFRKYLIDNPIAHRLLAERALASSFSATKSARGQKRHFSPDLSRVHSTDAPCTSSLALVTQVMSRLLPFVVNIMVARRLTPEEYGVPTVRLKPRVVLSSVIDQRVHQPADVPLMNCECS